jgi:methylamine--corrinoid protein Co-methyltransferase
MNDGPLSSVKEWDMKIVPRKIKEKLKEYGLEGTCTPKDPISSDDGLADKFWEAGFDLAVDVGMLCVDTERIIKFSKEELQARLNELPIEVKMGVGAEEVVTRKRTIEDKRPPICFLGPFGIHLTEEYFVPIVQSHAQYRVIDGVLSGLLNTVQGYEAPTKTPLEMLAGAEGARLTLEACKRAFRPGLAVTYSCGVSEIGTIGQYLGYQQEGTASAGNLHWWDGIAGSAELKITYDSLDKVAFSLLLGHPIESFHHSMIGGYAGGPEGCAVSRIAAAILMASICRSVYFQNSVYDIRYLGNSGREAVWANNISSQGIVRNSRMLLCETNNPVAGPCTDMILYEVGVNSILNAVDGNAWMIGIRSGGGRFPDYTTGLESKFAAEVAKAASGMKRSDANEVIKKLIPKYEDRLRRPPMGKAFKDCFDVKSITPSNEWMEIYRRVTKEFKDLGVPL